MGSLEPHYMDRNLPSVTQELASDESKEDHFQ